MREMKDSGIEWIKQIPIEWKIMPNKYLMTKIKEINPVFNGEDILSLTMNGVIVRDLYAGGKMPTSFDGYQRVHKGNLLMCLFDIDVTPRCVGLIKNEGITSPAYSQFKCSDLADARYYNYYYMMLDNDKTLLHLSKNLRHSLTEDLLGMVPTVVPHLREQVYIADFLDEKCDEIDSLINDIQKQIAILEFRKKELIIKGTIKGLNNKTNLKDSGIFYIGETNSSWFLTKIGYVCTKLTRAINDEDVPLICSNKGKVLERGENLIGLMTSEDHAMQGINKGDIAIHGMDTWHGAIAISDYDGKITRVVHVCDSTEDKRFIVYYLQALAFKGVYKLISNGIRENTSDFRSWEKVKDIYISLPEKKEQGVICDYLDEVCKKTEDVIRKKQNQINILEKYKKSLIYEYVTGKKEVR